MNRKDNRESERRKQIFRAATEKFSEKGYSGTTMEDIAQEAGVSKGTLYYYFDSKGELFHDLVSDWFQQFESSWEEVLEEDSAKKRLIKLHRTMMATIEESESVSKLMIEFWANASRENTLEELMKGWLNSYRNKVAEIIQEGINQGEFEGIDAGSTSRALLAAYDGLWFHWVLDPDAFPLRTAGRELLSSFLRGMGQEEFEWD